jgi:hypothetical protein
MPAQPVAKVYRDLLYPRGKGLALWFPDNEVHIGDVGFFMASNGKFWRLFNVLVPPDHPLNSQGVPESFVCWDPESRVDSNSNVLSPGQPIMSEQVFETGLVLGADG